jgi:hypothetical protein
VTGGDTRDYLDVNRCWPASAHPDQVELDRRVGAEVDAASVREVQAGGAVASDRCDAVTPVQYQPGLGGLARLTIGKSYADGPGANGQRGIRQGVPTCPLGEWRQA